MSSANHRQTAEALTAELYGGGKLILLTEDGTLSDRLVRAYAEMSVHAAPLAEQLPGHLRRRVATLHGILTGGAGMHDGVDPAAIAAAVAALRPEERARAALDISDLADDLDLEVRTTVIAPDHEE